MLVFLCLTGLFLNAVGANSLGLTANETEALNELLDVIRESLEKKIVLLREELLIRLRTRSLSSQEYPEGFTQDSLQSSTSESYTTKSDVVESSYATNKPESLLETFIPEKNYEGYPENTSHIGTIRGIPGVNFPNYTDIPVTSFSCSSKAYIPGFYADLETECQVFHACLSHRQESFLCPVGTTFNQAILTCDFWYSSNCSLASYYYNVNAQYRVGAGGKESKTLFMEDAPTGKNGKIEFTSPTDIPKMKEADLSLVMKLLPVKAKVVVYPETVNTRSKIEAEASIGKRRKSKDVKKVTEKAETEIFESEYIPDKSAYSSGHNHESAMASAKDKTAYARHGLNSAFSKVKEVLDFVGNIVREGENFNSALSSAKHSPKLQKPASTRHRPLTKLN